MTSFFVRTPNPRPYYGSVAVFLWDDQHDFDSDGDCLHAADRNWTELTLVSRVRKNERIDVDPASDEPLTLKVQSDQPHLSARVAYYLALATDGALSGEFGGEYAGPAAFRERLSDFDVESALERVTDYMSRRT